MDGRMKHLMSRGTIKWMAYIKCIWSAMDGCDTLGMDYVDRMHLECAMDSWDTMGMDRVN